MNAAHVKETTGRTTDPPTCADTARISEMLDAIAAISKPGRGVTRLGYTDLERQAHELVGQWLRERGLDVHVDAMGNTIAELPGSEMSAPAIGTGSHLDSVPHGGIFDGIVGVVGAVEAVRLLTARPGRLRHPLRVVIFACEEGARFGQACVGSKGVAGQWTEESLSALTDADGMSLADAMRATGFDPSLAPTAAWDRDDWLAFLELHVEQGEVLESAAIPIGVADLISGSTRLLLEISGVASHTGGTPMALRHDALAAAAEIVLVAEDIATDARHRGTRATVGRLDVAPNSITTIPGRVSLVVDVRDVDSDRQRSTAAEIVRHAAAIGDRRGTQVRARLLSDASPAVLPVWLRNVVTAAATALGHPYRVMPSGASHDCQIVNRVVPSALLFVPSRGGLSHVPDEWTGVADIARGVNVLTRAILDLDRLRGNGS